MFHSKNVHIIVLNWHEHNLLCFWFFFSINAIQSLFKPNEFCQMNHFGCHHLKPFQLILIFIYSLLTFYGSDLTTFVRNQIAHIAQRLFQRIANSSQSINSRVNYPFNIQIKFSVHVFIHWAWCSVRSQQFGIQCFINPTEEKIDQVQLLYCALFTKCMRKFLKSAVNTLNSLLIHMVLKLLWLHLR